MGDCWLYFVSNYFKLMLISHWPSQTLVDRFWWVIIFPDRGLPWITYGKVYGPPKTKGFHEEWGVPTGSPGPTVVSCRLGLAHSRLRPWIQSCWLCCFSFWFLRFDPRCDWVSKDHRTCPNSLQHAVIVCIQMFHQCCIGFQRLLCPPEHFS